MSNQIPDKNYIYKGLLGYNYFPMIALYRDGTPPVFSTEDFTPEVANEMLKENNKHLRKKGYDSIEYRVTRLNQGTRLMHIPHPLPYARLCQCISNNWDKLKHICENPNSHLKPA